MNPLTSRRRLHFYAFGSLLLNEDERVLLRSTETVPLSPKAFDMLLVLVKSAGLVLDKEELMEKVWPDAFVEEANLAVNISTLRKAMGEMLGGGQYIETLPKRGYRFAASVTEFWEDPAESKAVKARLSDCRRLSLDLESERSPSVASSDSSQFAILLPASPGDQSRVARNRRALAIGLTSLLVLATAFAAHRLSARRSDPAGQPRRLAVLPFENQRPDEQTDYLGYALADSVINKLDLVKSLVVRPSSYVEKYVREKKPLREAARELNVDTLLTGSYVRDGEDLIVNAQLIDVDSDQKLWSESINVKYDKLLDLQDHVARQVVKGLKLSLTDAEGKRFNNNNPTGDPVAYEYFLRSRYLLSTNNHRRAIELLTESVKLDPNNALAWAYLGRAYHIDALQFSLNKEELSEAEADYEQALALEPDLGQAKLMMAKLFTETGRVEKALPLLLELVRTDPGMAEAHWELSYAFRYGGLLDESIEEGERAIQTSARLESHQFNSYLYTGQYQKFLDSLPTREDAYVVFYRGLGHYYLNDTGSAAAAFDRAYDLNQSSVITQIGKALRLAIAGKTREGQNTLKAAEAKITTSGPGDGEITYKLAQVYDALGDKASALRALDRSVEQGFFCYPYFAGDPLLKNVRLDQSFQPILNKARRRRDAFKRTLEVLKSGT